MAFELNAEKVLEHLIPLISIPPGTDLPKHIEDCMVDIGTSAVSGPYVKVYLCEDAATRDLPIVFTVSDRADFRHAYRNARMMRPGGAANRR